MRNEAWRLPQAAMNTFANMSFLLLLLLATQTVASYPWPEKVTQHSGYITIESMENGKVNYFYWMFESRQDPSSDPLLLWLTGGPGCSSELSLFLENGPFVINGTNEPTFNPYGWNSFANLLYVDQPGGTGFTYFTKPGQYVSNEEQISHELWTFMLMFYEHYPRYANLDLYVFGESYAGHYVPAVGRAILESNSIYSKNLKGIAIGNGWTDPYIQYNEYAPFGYSVGLITKDQMGLVYYQHCKEALDKKDWKVAYTICEGIPSSLLAYARAGLDRSINPYDYTQPCLHPPLCYDTSKIENFLNREDVRKALGVDRSWSPCNRDVKQHLLVDWVQNLDSAVSMILGEQKRVLVYTGVFDFICNYFGGRAWTNATKWSGQEMFQVAKFKDWMVDGSLAGQVKSYEQLTFLEVANAGQFVPYNVPKMSLEIVRNFINNKPFA